MAENQVYLIKSGQNSFVEETEAIVGISGGKVGIGTTAPEADLHVTGSVKIGGDLAVDGTFTTINSSTISVDDKNIELGSTDNPTDVTADGGGITVKGATDKTFNWIDATDAWTSSEHLHLAAGKDFAADSVRALGAGGLNIGDDAGNGIFVQDGGKVGVATANPGYDLDVNGSGNFNSLYIQGNSVLTGDGSIFGKWEDGATQGEIFYTGGNVGVGTIDPSAQLHVVGSTLLNGNVSASGINAIDAGGLTLGDDAGNGIFVEDGGQVGVNTITPNYNLHVNGTAHVGDNFSVGGDISGSGIKAIDANGLTLGDDAGNGIFVEDGGQVGIGTTAPGYNLDVVGNGNFSQGLYVNGNSVLTGSAADLGKWEEGANSEIFYNDGNVGVGTSDPSVKLEVVGDSLFNGDLSVGSAFSVSTNGSVGGILPTSAGQVVGWDGSSWRPITSAGGGGSSSEVPEAFVQSLASGQSEYTINFTQTYDSAPAISTDLQIDGAGDIIPYAISEVTTSGYSISFAKDLPNDNYKIHTNFGGRDVFWTTGALGSINYSGGDVSIQDSLSVGANLTVQGNAVLTGSTADLGKWDEGAGSEIYYSDGNVGVGTSNPSYTLHVNGTIYNENGELNVANKFNVSSLGAVGGQSPAFNEVIKWDGSKWIAGSAPGGGDASSSEVPSAFDTWLTQGSSVQAITFVDAPEGGYQSIPSISTDVEIVDGDIIPYAISGVSTTGYYAVFSDPIPTANNYKIHTTFGGKEVYWKTGAGGSSIYYDGDSVSVDDLVVGGNLTVNGTTTTVNTQTVEIEDHNLVIAANTGYNQLTAEYPGAGGAYAGILWGTGDAGAASPVSLTYQTNKGFAFEGGNVGIGTTNPGHELHVIGTAKADRFYDGSDDTHFGSLVLYDENGNTVFDRHWSGGDTDFIIKQNGVDQLTIKENGSVGIGTANPSSSKLDVQGGYINVKANGGLANLRLGSDGSNDIYMPPGQNLHISAADNISFRVGSSLGQLMFINGSSGNVGIGTTNPAALLDIKGPNAVGTFFAAMTAGVAGVNFKRVNQSSSPYNHFLFHNGNVGIGTQDPTADLHINSSVTATTADTSVSSLRFQNGDSFNNSVLINGRTDVSGATDYTDKVGLMIATRGQERMRITSSGNVGIGTPDPGSYNFVLNSSNADSRMKISSSNSSAASIFFGEDAGGGGTPAWIQRYGSTHTTKPSKVEIGAVGSGSWIAIQGDGGDILNVRGSGRVGIGTTNPGQELHVNGTIRFEKGNGANNAPADPVFLIAGNGYQGQMTADGTAFYIGQNSTIRELRMWSGSLSTGVKLTNGSTSWGTYSDEKLKTNITDVGSVLDKISGIRCVNYQLINDESSQKRIGFIAQDFVDKFDEVVEKPSKITDDFEGEYLGLRYTEIVPVIMKAVQEQQQIIEDLKSQNESLAAQNADFESRISQLEQ